MLTSLDGQRLLNMYSRGTHGVNGCCSRLGFDRVEARKYLRSRGFILIGRDAGETHNSVNYAVAHLKGNRSDFITPDEVNHLMRQWPLTQGVR